MIWAGLHQWRNDMMLSTGGENSPINWREIPVSRFLIFRNSLCQIQVPSFFVSFFTFGGNLERMQCKESIVSFTTSVRHCNWLFFCSCFRLIKFCIIFWRTWDTLKMFPKYAAAWFLKDDKDEKRWRTLRDWQFPLIFRRRSRTSLAETKLFKVETYFRHVPL